MLYWQAPSTLNPYLSSGTKDFAEKHEFHPPNNGTQFRIVEFKPTGDVTHLDPQFIIKFFGLQKLAKRAKPVRHPLMHRTETVDYAVVLEGEITLLLDDSEVHLKAGDVVIQRGTNHAWSNRSGKPVRMLYVLMDGQFDTNLSDCF